MNWNYNARFRITAISAMAGVLLAIMVVVMLNQASATITGDQPPGMGMGDWVINNPTRVVDESISTTRTSSSTPNWRSGARPSI